MNRDLGCLAFLLVFMAMIAGMGAQKSAPQNPPATRRGAPKPAESFWAKVLRVSGVSHDPSTLKGPGDEVVAGQIWLASPDFGQPRQLTVKGGYRSPVFIPVTNDILALAGTDVVRVPHAGGNARRLFKLDGAAKLVGFSLDDPDAVLVLSQDGSGNRSVGMLSLSSGILAPLVYNPAAGRDLQMIEHLQSWNRVYGDRSVYLERQSKETLSGTVEWSDVLLKAGSQSPVNVSQCDEVNCGQPSVSADGTLVVFIKSDQH